MKRILSILLTIFILLSFMPIHIFASNEEDFVPIIKYTVDGEEELAAALQEIGTWTTTSKPTNPGEYATQNKVYLTLLPYGATISSWTVTGEGYDAYSLRLYGKNKTKETDMANFCQNPNNFVSGTEFRGTGLGAPDPKATNSEEYARYFLGYLDNREATIAKIPTNNDYHGFCIRQLVKKDKKMCMYQQL